jgi:nicotinate-nucleotide--dimethylbenzimidazole phosphoribosyltransferase
MAANQNQDETSENPIEDGLSALKRLADLDESGRASQQAKAPDVTDKIPDWLELLLAKYGEHAFELIGIEPDLGSRARRRVLIDLSPKSEEASEVASLLEQMATDSETEPPTERRITPVDWGEPAAYEDEAVEDQASDWLDQMARTPEPPPVPPVPDEPPDWLTEIGEPRAETEIQAEGPQSPRYSAAEEELPEWLSRLAEGSASEVEEAPTSEPSQAEPPSRSPADMAAEAPAELEEGVPDWLVELEMAEEAPVEPSAPKEPPTLPAEMETKAPAKPQEELPDWLLELEIAEEAPAEPPESEVPPTPPGEMTVEARAEGEEAVPDWLRQLEMLEEAPSTQPPAQQLEPEAPAEPEPEVPDWLASLREETPSPLEMMTEDEVPLTEYPAAEDVEEPDWLAALRTDSKADVFELDAELVETEEEDLPDWLAELRVSQAAVEAPPPVAEEPPELVEAETDAVVVEYHPPSEVEAAIPEAEEVEFLPAELEYPSEEEAGALDWLAEIEAAAEISAYAEGEVPPAEVEIAAEPEEVPDWLRQMPPAELTPEEEEETVETRRPADWLVAEAPLAPGEEEAEVSPLAEETLEIEEVPSPGDEVAPGEVPDWLLELKPVEEEALELREEEAVESEDVLAGIPGLLPIAEEEPEGEKEPVATLPSGVGVPAVPDVEGAQLFREVVTEPAEAGERERAEARPETRRGRLVETLVWALIFIILIAGIALALVAVLGRVGDLLGGTAFGEFWGSPMVIDPAPVNTFRAQVTKLPPDAVVVVSFDYSPATEAEMEPLAQIILGDLLENQARVIAVSLRPEGAIMAQRLLERFEDEYPYGERTINLGYLPGQTAGVRSLAFLSSTPLFQNWTQTLDDYPAWQDVEGLDDVALTVAVADSPLTVRWWVEQMGPGTLANRPMVAAVSAAADPSVRPYYNRVDPKSGQLLGLVSGVADAAAYENRLGQPDRAVRSLAAQSVAHLGLIVVGLAGAVVGFRTQATKEE